VVVMALRLLGGVFALLLLILFVLMLVHWLMPGTAGHWPHPAPGLPPGAVQI
jgi:flagellin-like protein